MILRRDVATRAWNFNLLTLELARAVGSFVRLTVDEESNELVVHIRDKRGDGVEKKVDRVLSSHEGDEVLEVHRRLPPVKGAAKVIYVAGERFYARRGQKWEPLVWGEALIGGRRRA